MTKLLKNIVILSALLGAATPLRGADNTEISAAISAAKDAPRNQAANLKAADLLKDAGRFQEAIPFYLKGGNSGNLGIAESYFYLYDFDKADEYLDKYLAKRTKNEAAKDMGFSYGNGDETLDWTDYLRSRIDLGRSMLDRVEKIQIVDSINVPADQFFKFIKLAKSAGRLADEFEIESIVPKEYLDSESISGLWAPAYISESGEDMIWYGSANDGESAHKAGLNDVSRDDLEAHYLAGGNVEKVVHALVSASKANIDLGFKMATAIDLAGRDVFQAVQMSVNPKVIETPHVTAVAKDGIQLIAIARVTVRANIRQLVGGAGEDTVLARVGEGIVSSIGSSESHKQVLENPDNISKLVLRKGLDSGTAFEILSIDIADIDIGKNIGAALQIDQAQADKSIAQAKAEERRAMAIALEQEMRAKAQEARAKVIEAEAELPRAMAQAFLSGNLGIMDYYRMKNIESDTNMRQNIANPPTAK